MPQGLQTLTFSAVAIAGTTFHAFSPIGTDSATVFNVPQGSVACLGEVWATDNLNDWEISITASRFHDQVYGIRAAVTSGAATAPINRAQCITANGLVERELP